VDWLSRDLGTGLRLLARDKAYSLTAAATLALCLGANTALFSVVHHVLLRPLPVPEPERILLMSNQYPRAGAGDSSNSGVPDYYDRLRDVTVFQEQALFNSTNVSLDQDGRPTRVRIVNVTPSYLRVMRTSPALGRPFAEEEGEVGNEKKVLLSDAMWRSQFAADLGAVGRDLRIDGQPYTIVGVMPSAFEALAPDGIYLMIEPKASSNLEDNIGNPFAPYMYGISVLHCLTVSLAEGGTGLGTCWGEQVARRMLAEAGLGRVEVVDAPGPQNSIYICRR